MAHRPLIQYWQLRANLAPESTPATIDATGTRCACHGLQYYVCDTCGYLHCPPRPCHPARARKCTPAYRWRALAAALAAFSTDALSHADYLTSIVHSHGVELLAAGMAAILAASLIAIFCNLEKEPT